MVAHNELSHLDTERRLYVTWHGSGYSCIGFDVAYRRAAAVAAWAGARMPDPDAIGTGSGFYDYRHAIEDGRAHSIRSGTRCLAEIHQQLDGLEGCRVEVMDADGETRRFWVGRSTGWLPCHLEVSSARDSGGPAADTRPYRSVRVVRRAGR